MEIKRLKQKNYVGNTTLRIYLLHFNTRHASNVISLHLPVSDYEKVWSIIPTVTYRHDISIVPGPSFTMKFKWLKWDILTLRWQRSYKDGPIDPQEEETAGPQTYLDQETWGPFS